VVLSRVRELEGHPREVINEAHLYDQLMEATHPASTRQTLQIIVKYSRSMKDLLKEIHNILPPRGTPKQMLDPGPPGSPNATLYEAIKEVELVFATQTGVGPSQPTRIPRSQESESFGSGEDSCAGTDPLDSDSQEEYGTIDQVRPIPGRSLIVNTIHDAGEGHDFKTDPHTGTGKNFGLRKNSYGLGLTGACPGLHDTRAVGASTLPCDDD